MYIPHVDILMYILDADVFMHILDADAWIQLCSLCFWRSYVFILSMSYVQICVCPVGRFKHVLHADSTMFQGQIYVCVRCML